MDRPRIVFLHATTVAMPPVKATLGALWPEAEMVNLLDDGLSADRAREGAELSGAMMRRFIDLGRYAQDIHADAILVTCSAFGPAIERMAARLTIPVFKPNEAMFREALACGPRIAMLATFAPAIPTMESEFHEIVREAGQQAELTSVLVDGALTCLHDNDVDGHDRLIAEAASELRNFDAIMLAHFSTSQAIGAVKAVTSIPVFSAPCSAIAGLRERVEDHNPLKRVNN